MNRRLRGEIIAIWQTLMAQSAMNFTVVEDLTRPHPSSIEAFAATVFVSDPFFEEIYSTPRPYLSELIYERILAGRSPILSTSDVRARNSSTGLHLVILHFGLSNLDLTHERTQSALQAGSAAFYFFHAGYRINSLLQEVHGLQQLRYMVNGGFRLLAHFRVPPTLTLAENASQQHRYLFVLKKDWVEPGAIDSLSLLFHTPLPVIYFSASEQRVLIHALSSESDLQIAANLGVSLDAVKKSWRALYERVSTALPYLFTAEPGSNGGRTVEKRRHVLDYLRSHPQELRPFAKVRTRPNPTGTTNLPALRD
jgi:hypothetical protein